MTRTRQPSADPATGERGDAANSAEPMVGYLHAAHRALDERPRDAVRAAILQAAAQTQAPAMPPSAGKRASGRRWLPWLMPAGTVAAVVLAVGLERHHTPSTAPPQVVAEIAATRPAAGNAGTDVAVPQAAWRPATAPAASGRNPGTANDGRQAMAAASAPPNRTSDRAQGGPELKQRVPPPSGDATPNPMAPVAPAPPDSGASADNARIVAVATPRMAPSAAAPKQMTSSNTYRDHADTWMRQIIELRMAHRDREADEELTRFKASHPDATIPIEAR